MILQNYLKKLTPSEIVYIGFRRGEGFAYIGDAKRAKTTLNKTVKAHRESIQNGINEAQRLVDKMEKAGMLRIENDELVGWTGGVAQTLRRSYEIGKDISRDLKLHGNRYTEKLTNKKKYIEKHNKILSIYSNVMEREVLEVYERISENPGAKVIIVEGIGPGGYWYLKDVERSKNNAGTK